MDEQNKLRVVVFGGNQFDATGSSEFVESMFKTFLDNVAPKPVVAVAASPEAETTPSDEQA